MPTYTYRCKKCDHPFEKILPLSQYKDPQDCPSCASPDTYRTIVGVNFVLKGDDWAGKSIKINRQMKKKNERVRRRMEARMKDDTSMPTLVPNVGGEEVDTWSEAKKLAASKGQETSSYDKYVRAEKEAK